MKHSISEIQAHWKQMSDEAFAQIKRDDLLLDVRPFYDRERECREDAEVARRRVEEFQRHIKNALSLNADRAQAIDIIGRWAEAYKDTEWPRRDAHRRRPTQGGDGPAASSLESLSYFEWAGDLGQVRLALLRSLQDERQDVRELAFEALVRQGRGCTDWILSCDPKSTWVSFIDRAYGEQALQPLLQVIQRRGTSFNTVKWIASIQKGKYLHKATKIATELFFWEWDWNVILWIEEKKGESKARPMLAAAVKRFCQSDLEQRRGLSNICRMLVMRPAWFDDQTLRQLATLEPGYKTVVVDRHRKDVSELDWDPGYGPRPRKGDPIYGQERFDPGELPSLAQAVLKTREEGL